MALVKFSFADLKSLYPAANAKTIEDDLAALGIPLEHFEGDEASAEITPNRPDWLSVEGIARSLSDFKSGKPKAYAALPASIDWTVEPSAKSVRPFLGSALVRGVKLSEAALLSIMQLQEKLHDTLGRGRRKLAIGLHNLSAVEPPFVYRAVGRESVRFVPLSRSVMMTCGQILAQHEKGIAFAHLVADMCPLIVDKNNEVLSFPPIINGERTRVSSGTVDILIDCTGLSPHAVNYAVQIVAAALVDRGGAAEEVRINGKPYPLFQPATMPLPLESAQKLLGIKLTRDQAISHLAKMGHRERAGKVQIMPWRADVAHSVDLVEDIAISYGYNNFAPTIPQAYSVGNLDDSLSPAHSALLGLGYFEVQSWMLTNSNVIAWAKEKQAGVALENPLTEEFSTLRPSLYPNHLQVFANSRTEPMPQYVYEIGTVFSDSSEENHVAACACHPKAGWAETRSHLSALFSSLGVEFALEKGEKEGFIPGRFANIICNGKKIGFAGEVHPEVLVAFGIEQPVSLFEFSASSLSKEATSVK